jgi:Common central domain of tyrosinase
MADGRYSPGDPAFYLHHCFIDKTYADWQAEGGADSFSGTHRGIAVSSQDRMSPKKWNRTVAQIIGQLSPCVQYEEPSRRGPNLLTSIKPSTRFETIPTADSEGAIKFESLEEKIEIQQNAAAMKILHPDTYKQKIFDAAVEDIFLQQAAREFSGMRDDEIYAFDDARKILTAKTQNLLTTDIRDPTQTVTKSNQVLVKEGISQLGALQVGQRLPGDSNDLDVKTDAS